MKSYTRIRARIDLDAIEYNMENMYQVIQMEVKQDK